MTAHTPLNTRALTGNSVTDTYKRDSTDTHVVVADGYGLSIRVHHGHLIVTDGIGRHRRERRYSRAERKVRRLVILGHTGFITLDAIRWCADVGIAICHIDSDGRVLTTSAPGQHDDARLRRAQARAVDEATGLAVTRYLLDAKLTGQAMVAEDLLDEPLIAERIREHAAELATSDLACCREIEAKAASLYFGSWYPQVIVSFARRDQDRVPDHWRAFIARTTPLHGPKTPRTAADPVNAMCNYGYALLEAEALTACAAVGLDPGLGILHTDKRDRASLALDLMETVRPDVDRYILGLLRSQVFRAADFHETRDGRCRLLPPLTHQLAGNGPAWHARLAPHAEQVAHLIGAASGAPIKRRTPLTQANSRARQGARRSRDASAPAPAKRCKECGVLLADKRRVLCDQCDTADRVRRSHEQIAAANRRLVELRAQGHDPAARPEVAERKRDSLRRNRAAMLEWQREHPGELPDRQIFLDRVQPGLRRCTIAEIQRATGLSASAASRVRSGGLVPHLRHWNRLEEAARQCDHQAPTRDSPRSIITQPMD